MASNKSWQKIFDDYKILEHNFSKSYYRLDAEQIKRSCQDFKTTSEKEVRVLCKQDTRQSRPLVFQENGLFILPIKNGQYAICKGEGYVDIPDITTPVQVYNSKLDFELTSSKVGDSEMQYLDYAYANSLIRTFMNDSSLVLTIRGRKYTPKFTFQTGSIELEVNGVQTEVDAGYEGRDFIVLVEAKNSSAKDTIIRQLYYPFRQWQENTHKKVYTLFFERRFVDNETLFYIWQYEFTDEFNYNSINLVKSGRFKIV